MGKKQQNIGGKHKPRNNAKRRQRERFNFRHPEGRKQFARNKRAAKLERKKG